MYLESDHSTAPFKGIDIPEFGKFLPVEYEILGFEIMNKAWGIWNSSSGWILDYTFWHRIRNPRRGIHNSMLSWIPFHWAKSDKRCTCEFSPVLYSASRDYILAVWTSYFLHNGSNRENVVSVVSVAVVLFAILKFKDELEQMGSSWGRTCFSDLQLRFDLVNLFFLFFPFNRFVPFPFLLLRLFVPDFCHFIVSFTRYEILFKQSLKKAIFSWY